ncbi:MAG: PEP-CTERM sorting domain-containing protein [Akkermansia sp.]|nr:PEP-CTERM sorting domain-containing protein [Akkermansia sp.]
MKKSLIALMALASIASAASIGYDEMTDTQKSGVVKSWNDSMTLTASSDIWANVNTNLSFTISFDITNINVSSTDSTIASFAGSHNANGWDDGKLLIRMSDSGSLTLINSHGTSSNSWSEYFDGSTFGNATVSAYSCDLGLTAAESIASITTYTLVSNADDQTFTIYKNGTQIDQWTNWNTDTGLKGLQLGGRFGGGNKLTGSETVDFDNVTIWDKALTAAEVGSIVIAPAVPEPTTATLSLLALAGLAARRRRK